MKRCLVFFALVVFAFAPSFGQPPKTQPAHKLLVVSVDGMDWRYIRDRDQLHLSIPNIRRLLAEGQSADGVIGVWPTVTWPSHTSLITGVRPDQHGILNNRRPKAEGGDYYWTPDLLHARTLWQCAADHNLTTAAVTWPVTTGAAITYDLPEYFQARNGGSMDLESIESKATPGLVGEIQRAYPSFPTEWVDDRTRTQAVLYLLREKRPDLILLHLVDLDSDAHDKGPYERSANAALEHTDELIGQMLKALPPGYDVALVSDHGFERVDTIANPMVLLSQSGIKGDLRALGGIVVTRDPKVAEFLRNAAQKEENRIGREIPHSELVEYAPTLSDAVAAFEPADHVMFFNASTGPYLTKPAERGNHGFWPTRHDYRSTYVLWGPDVKQSRLPTIQMITIKNRLASVLGVTCNQ